MPSVGPRTGAGISRILARKRDGQSLTDDEIASFVRGVTDGSWDDGQVGAFLMAIAIRGLDSRETAALTVAMVESGERWDLAEAVPRVVDKHSTGGVGDKVSMLLGPLLVANGLSMAKLTGRGLGHTGGTADKLESIPGMKLDLERGRALDLLERVGMMVAIATNQIAPADKRMYALRHVTGTVESLPLVVSSILSKKLSVGAASLIFDVKTGNGAVFSDGCEALSLARLLVDTAARLACPAVALVTDMSQPLGYWAGNIQEVGEVLECLSGKGNQRLLEVTFSLGEELSRTLGEIVTREAFQKTIDSGHARECFEKWAAAQGAELSWLARPTFGLAPVEVLAIASRSGVLAEVDTRGLGNLLLESGAGRHRAVDAIDPEVALHYPVELGQRVEAGEVLARLFVRRRSERLERRFIACFTVADSGEAPTLIRHRVPAS